MSIVSHPANKNYRDNFAEVFGQKPKRPNECKVYNTTCPTPELCKLDDPEAPCVAGQVNDQDDDAKSVLRPIHVQVPRVELGTFSACGLDVAVELFAYTTDVAKATCVACIGHVKSYDARQKP